MTTRKLVPLAAIAISALALAGCAGTDPDPAPAAAPADSGDVARYCALVAELNGIGERIFADLPEDAAPEELMRGQAMLVQQGAAQLAELEQVVPAEIRADVPIFLADLRARATGTRADPAAAEAAEERILAFDERNCPGGAQGS